MNKRVFTAKEIAKLLTSQAGSETELNLGNGLRAVRMATKDRPVFQIDRAGKDLHNLDDAVQAELAELSAIVWSFADQFGPSEDALEELLTPERFKDKPEPENIEADPLGLTPDHLREIIKDPALARRLATGTATKEEGLDALLTPDSIMEQRARDAADAADPLGFPGDAKGE